MQERANRSDAHQTLGEEPERFCQCPVKIEIKSLSSILCLSFVYRIYSINRPGRLLNFWTLRVGAYSRRALIRGWALIKFSPFSASEVCLF